MTEVFRLNFNSLRPELLLALALNGVWLVVVGLAPRAEQPRPLATGADAPQLLRLSRKLLVQEEAQRRALPLIAAMDALPPPPPPELLSPPPRPVIARAARALPPTGWVWSTADSDLPAEPAEALELSQAWLPGNGTPVSDPSAASLEIRRRQLWLTPGQAQQLQALWQRSSSLPSPFEGLPAGTSVRRMLASARSPLGLAKPHGFSLVLPDDVVLFWRQGQQVWLLRSPLNRPAGTA
jgi:hypothetical protein